MCLGFELCILLIDGSGVSCLLVLNDLLFLGIRYSYAGRLVGRRGTPLVLLV